jgi:glutaredoxin
MYTTHWCPDCRRAKYFLTQRGVRYLEINIEEDPSAEAIVLRANHGKRKVRN